MVLTSKDHTAHRGEGERGELDKDEHLQQHQPTKSVSKSPTAGLAVAKERFTRALQQGKHF